MIERTWLAKHIMNEQTIIGQTHEVMAPHLMSTCVLWFAAKYKLGPKI